MLFQLEPVESSFRESDRRRAVRLAPVGRSLSASVLAADGRRYPTGVVDLSSGGARLSGGFPVSRDDRVVVDVQLNTDVPAIKMEGVVVRTDSVAVAVRFEASMFAG